MPIIDTKKTEIFWEVVADTERCRDECEEYEGGVVGHKYNPAWADKVSVGESSCTYLFVNTLVLVVVVLVLLLVNTVFLVVLKALTLL